MKSVLSLIVSQCHSLCANTWFCRSVDVYRCPELELLCKIQVHRKLVNVIRWHPEYTAQSQELSPSRFWLATGSNEAMVSVVNLQNVLGNKGAVIIYGRGAGKILVQAN